jgi:hypothetical protein
MNYKRWADKPAWSLEEAAALLLQRGPSVVNIRSLGLEELRLLEGPVDISWDNVQFGPDLEREFAWLLARMVDSVAAGTLTSDGTSVTPADLIFWAGPRALKGPLTRSLVEAVGADHLYDQIDPHPAGNRLPLWDAADYLSARGVRLARPPAHFCAIDHARGEIHGDVTDPVQGDLAVVPGFASSELRPPPVTSPRCRKTCVLVFTCA